MNQPNQPRPTGITLDKPGGQLIVKWSDGDECHYPLNNLREACPCVECRGGQENMGRQSDPKDILSLTPPKAYPIDNIELWGNYPLQPFWPDSHPTGLYPWQSLNRFRSPGPPHH